MNKKLIKKNDIILAALLIAAAAAILIFSTGSGSASAAEVYSHGELIRTIDLEHVENEYTIELGGEYNIIIGVRKNGVRFVRTSCASTPDGSPETARRRHVCRRPHTLKLSQAQMMR